MASYLHSVFVHFVLCLFIYLVYTSSSKLGSPSVVYKKLMAVTAANRNCSLTNPDQHCGPVAGNKGGSYLTMMSMNGFVFGIINVVGNFGTVFVDNVSLVELGRGMGFRTKVGKCDLCEMVIYLLSPLFHTHIAVRCCSLFQFRLHAHPHLASFYRSHIFVPISFLALALLQPMLCLLSTSLQDLHTQIAK